jgi:choline dehydrogenase-like flavoprotein
VRGTKLVLVSAGTFGSPGILERSGIGAEHVLERVGMKQRVDLPGVGENYQGCSVKRPFLSFPPFFLILACSFADHNILFARYFAADEAQTLDALFRSESGAIEGGSIPFIGRRIYVRLINYESSCGHRFRKDQGTDLDTQVCHHLAFDSLLTHVHMSIARLMRGSSGARNRPRWPSSVPSFKSIGSHTLPMRQTSLSYVWV